MIFNNPRVMKDNQTGEYALHIGFAYPPAAPNMPYALVVKHEKIYMIEGRAFYNDYNFTGLTGYIPKV